ncbi:MAG TPA: extracellular solute-binding protein [Methylomirabilota bacterium]|nr:extracellular solute-binding protein [Methylomirabilota bacterium]
MSATATKNKASTAMSLVAVLLAVLTASIGSDFPIASLIGFDVALAAAPVGKTDGKTVSDKLPSLIKAAQAEGMLNLVWGENTFHGLTGVRELVAGMNKQYGTSVIANWTPGPSQPQMAARIAQEFAAGVPATSDVYIGGSESYIATLASPLMVLEQVDWASYFPQIDATAVQLKGAAIEISGRFPGIVYNTRLIAKNDAPKSLMDLLNPKFKGKVSTQPYVGYFDILSGPKQWGPERTADYVQKLSGQVSGLMRCGEYERVVSGEFPIHALACGEGGVLPFTEKGAPLRYVIPSDAAMVTHRYCGVPKNARSRNAAKLFCAFLLTKSGQEFQWNVDRQDSEKIPGTRYYRILSELHAGGVKPLNVSVDYVMSFPVLKYAKNLEDIIKVAEK